MFMFSLCVYNNHAQSLPRCVSMKCENSKFVAGAAAMNRSKKNSAQEQQKKKKKIHLQQQQKKHTQSWFEEDEEDYYEDSGEIDALIEMDEDEDEDEELVSTADSLKISREIEEYDDESKKAKIRETFCRLRQMMMVERKCGCDWGDAAAVFEEAIRRVKALQLQVANLGLDRLVYAAALADS